jgi:hypothetical protein
MRQMRTVKAGIGRMAYITIALVVGVNYYDIGFSMDCCLILLCKDWYLSFLKQQGLLDKFVNEYPKISTLPKDAYLDAFFTSEACKYLTNYKEEKPAYYCC